ncbi:hypothetical protein KKC45_00530 [Patescibacteria group bacterium]|nr:hypothetical protein [Patescibacteria group bacterium]
MERKLNVSLYEIRPFKFYRQMVELVNIDLMDVPKKCPQCEEAMKDHYVGSNGSSIILLVRACPKHPFRAWNVSQDVEDVE